MIAFMYFPCRDELLSKSCFLSFCPMLGSLASLYRTSLTLYQKMISNLKPTETIRRACKNYQFDSQGGWPLHHTLCSAPCPLPTPHAIMFPWAVWPKSQRLCCITLSSYGCHLPSGGQSKFRNPAKQLRDIQLTSTFQPKPGGPEAAVLSSHNQRQDWILFNKVLISLQRITESSILWPWC